MEIRLAVGRDHPNLRRYDRHIPSIRLSDCVNNHQVYVLTMDGTVVGVLRYSLFWQTIPFLDLIYLDETIRGQGWGSKMMDFWERQMAQLGYDHVMLSTQADETAQEFYRKLGYEPAGAFWPPEQDVEELMFRKKLG